MALDLAGGRDDGGLARSGQQREGAGVDQELEPLDRR
jgi:hypothetical protein